MQLFRIYIAIMSSLKFLVASRKNFRSSVTRIYNDWEQYATYSSHKKDNVKLKLSTMQAELKVLDLKIAEMKFAETEDETFLMLKWSNANVIWIKYVKALLS